MNLTNGQLVIMKIQNLCPEIQNTLVATQHLAAKANGPLGFRTQWKSLLAHHIRHTFIFKERISDEIWTGEMRSFFGRFFL